MVFKLCYSSEAVGSASGDSSEQNLAPQYY